jgi:CTP synthase
VPYLHAAGELKTKPTQHSVKDLSGIGIAPDILVCRADHELPYDVRAKISMFCNLPVERVFQNLNARSLYEVPLMLHDEGLDAQVVKLLNLPDREADLSEWKAMVKRQMESETHVTIGLVGKYVELPDAYLSVVEALTHGGIHHGVKVKIDWIPAEGVTPENVEQTLAGANGIVVPGGFGERGLEGKMTAIQYARENGLPFLGLCLGMQMAVIEFARHVLEMRDAHTTEVDPHSTYPVIDLMADQDLKNLGGTMRLGKYRCLITPGTVSERAYGTGDIWERHRHRYEFNNEYLERFMTGGMVIAGRNPDRNLVEIIEIPGHPFFVGVQFHPELKSRPNRPHPLFRAFIGAAVKDKAERQ